MVFVQHYLAPFHPWMNWGWAGVDIFFVLSGFLITGILFDTQNAPHRLSVFYMRRTLRIFPLYYGVLFALLLTTPVFHWFWNRASLLWFVYLGNYARFFFAHSSLIQPGGSTGWIDHLFARPLSAVPPTILFLGHFWSLCIEEQFYLVWPFVVFLIGRRTTLRNLCLLSLPVVLAARILCVRTVPHLYLEYGLLTRALPLRADSLLLGGALALMIRGPESDRLRRLALPLFLLFVAGFLVWQALYRHHFGAFYNASSDAPILTTLGYTLIDLAAGLLILSLLRLNNPLAHLLNLAPLRSLGRISYGFYVFHDIFHFVIQNALLARFGPEGPPHYHLVVAALAFLLTLTLALLSYHLFETPFLRLKSRFTIRPARLSPLPGPTGGPHGA